MNEALIQRRTSHTDPCRVAAQGLEQLGYSLVWFDDDSLPADEVRRDCLVQADDDYVFADTGVLTLAEAETRTRATATRYLASRRRAPTG